MRAVDLLARTRDCAFALRNDGSLAGWNAAAERLFGFRSAGAAGRSCHQILACRDLLGSDPSAPGCPLLRAVQARGAAPGVDFLARDRTGQSLPLSGSVVLLPAAYDARAMVLVRPAFDLLGALPCGSLGQTDLAGSLDRLLTATAADAAEVFLVAPGGQQLVLVAHRGSAPRAFREILRFERGQGFPGLVAATGKPLASVDLGHDDRFLRSGVKRLGFHTCFCVPLQSRGELLGSLQIAYRRRAGPTGATLPILERVAPQLAAAVELDRLRAADALSRLVRQPGVDASEALRHVAGQALQILMETAGADRGALLLADDSTGLLQVVSERAAPPTLRHQLARGQPVDWCPALVRRSGMLPCDRRADASPCCELVHRHLATALCLPLQVDGPPFGVALLGGPGPEPLPTRRLAFLHAVLERAAAVIRDARAALREESAARTRAAGVPRALASAATSPPRAGCSPDRPFLDLRVLGPLTIFRDGLLVGSEQFARRRSLTLLKILLTRYGKPVHREELIELLWPDGDPRSGGDRLHVLVHYLRRGLEPRLSAGQPSTFILNSGDFYTFNTAAPHRLDSQEFLATLRQSEQHERRGETDQALVACGRAVRLYAGDLLEDEPYSDWCALEREYLRERFLGLLRRAAYLEAQRGDFEAAAASCRRALQVDPTLEDVHRGLMKVLHLSGRPTEALRQYQECQAILRRELGVAPAPRTEALRQRIAAAYRRGQAARPKRRPGGE